MSKLYVYKDKDGNVVEKRRYNKAGFLTYCENSSGRWWKKRFNKAGIQIRVENSEGIIYQLSN